MKGSTLSVKGGRREAICPVTLTVTDADGTTFSQPFNVIITTEEIN